MMTGTKTRTQRRMERKQALTLLVLVLIVSLASFTLGVIVGRRGAERDLAQQTAEPRRIMVAEVPKPQSVAGQPAREEAPAEEDKLTFYDNLSRGEAAPLGSGINLPPEEPKPVIDKPRIESAPVVSKVPAAVAKVAPVAAVPQAKAVSSPAPATGAIPPAVASGTYSVQVGSFASVADAGRFKKNLVAKGYPVFIAEADLGKKGIWYRVRLGPYVDAEVAQRALNIAAQRDNIKGFISRL